MSTKKIVLDTPIADLTPELFGYSSVKFIDWEPEEFLFYSTGNEQVKDVKRGDELNVAGDFLLYKESKAYVTLKIELRQL